MPPPTFAEFERAWPWLTKDEAEAKVATGQHGMNILHVGQIAEFLGYEEWFYSNVNGGMTETLAFQKKRKDKVQKVLFYPSTGAVSICRFQQPKQNCKTCLRQAHNFYKDKHGIVPPRDDSSDPREADDLFNSKSYKKMQMFPKVRTLKEWQQILEDSDSLYSAPYQLFQRKDLVLGLWGTHCAASDADCKACPCSGGLFDCSLRWHHMMVAAGLGLEHIPAVSKVCNLFEKTLFWGDGPACLASTRFACGSLCAILEMLFEIGKEHHRVLGYCDMPTAQKLEDGRILFPALGRDFWNIGWGHCQNLPAFMKDQGQSMKTLKDSIVALPGELRRALLVFYFERTSGYYETLTLVDFSLKPLSSSSKYYVLLRNASLDYSRMLVGDHSEEQYCYRYGLFHRASREEEDQGETGTVATEESWDDVDLGLERSFAHDEEDKDIDGDEEVKNDEDVQATEW